MLWFARPWQRDRPPLVTAAIRLGLEENGLREPIVVEGKIRDGRNRFCACGELGIQPELEYFNGGAPAAFVLSMNLHRRHLTTSQRAMIAAEIAHTNKAVRQKIQICMFYRPMPHSCST
jgi:hypothetical protein